MQIQIPQKAFLAVSLAMSVKDIRSYICGVMLEHNGEETRLVATDGHRMHAVIVTHENALTSEPFQIILPAAMVKTICKAKMPRGGYDTITITVDAPKAGFDDTGKAIVVQPAKASALLPDGTETVASLIDGKFPDYMRVIPDGFSNEVGQYNPELVADALKGAGYWLESKAWQYCADFIPGGRTNSGGVSVPGFVAVVMCTRMQNEHYGIDSSFKNALRKPEVVATMAPEVAAWLDSSGALQDAGLVRVSA